MHGDENLQQEMSEHEIGKGMPPNGPESPHCIVGIGASAGGLEALELFFDPMPPDSGMAFIVVQHLSPDYKSLMPHILSKNTRMLLVEVEHDMYVEPNRVYLIPPRKNMTIAGGRLQLTDSIPRTGLRLPIDMFFRSLAADFGSRAVAVVLSGAGSDGSRGILAIKEAGGLVIAQDGFSAKFDGMPSSACQTGVVDAVLAPQLMAERLIAHAQTFQTQEKREFKTATITIEQYIQLILDKIKQASGIDFTYYKRNSVLRRIERRMAMNNVADISDYLAFLGQQPEELHALRKDLLIGVTNFFRDAEAFKVLDEKVLPRIFANNGKNREIRVWVAGCSTGEEAYSIAILMRRHADRMDVPYTIKIFATDLDKESIEYASQGVYSESINSHLSEDDIARYFIKDDGMFQVTKEIRKMIVFAPHNIIKDPPFSNLDLITCRNMLIYLQPEMQFKVLSLFHFALTPEGFLFLGPSETIGKFTNQFEPLDRHWNIFSHKGAKQPGESRGFGMPGQYAQTSPRAKLQLPPAVVQENKIRRQTDDLQTILTDEHLAPSMVIDTNNEVVHLNGAINDYLLLASGTPSLNVYKMVDSSLGVAISTAMQKIRKERMEVVYRSLAIRTNRGDRTVDLKLRPFSAKNAAFGKHILVLFEEPEQPARKPAQTLASADLDRDAKTRIFELEQELQRTEEALQATVEELETSNEELQSTNEELVAANEELQSANEELQSVNEELVTVNTEYQFKIQELTDLNNDMNNFLVSTRIGTIFLDKRMCIRRFTPAITKEINLMDVDCGRPIDHISHHFKDDALVSDARNVLQTLVPLEREIQSHKGTWYSMRILPYRTEDNFVSGVVLTFVDITDLKTVNEELLKLSYAIEQSPSITMMTDTAGTIEYVNPQFTMVTGYLLEEAYGLNMQTFSRWEEGERSFEAILNSVGNGKVWTGELESRAKNGNTYWESVKIIPIKDDHGQLIHFVKLSENISERKNAEEMLRKTEMLSAVGQMAAGIAHEIRNPLTALKGFTKLISNTGDSKSSYIGIMLDELDRIEQIVGELLVLAKPQAVDFANKELGPIVQDVLMLLESQANLGGVEMHSELQEGLRVLCVENQLKQVFINLLKNAIEAMPKGGRIHVQAAIGADNRIIVRFIDNGAGIPESKLAKLGEPFYSTKEKGTGLGLMVSHKIIENHQGSIAFQSKEGFGTTVTIELPALLN
ncbi:PAS domain S-box protein [Paenibacillus sp. T1]|uniref:PAS domain S-box protein n=2 Tax=Paenibacillus glycinis TaxID=2697035 RepID=A0ABW9XPB6_9BACL|nr:PAS domain S-box protein [Paenibacillus glycinis]